MVFSSVPLYLDPPNWQQHPNQQLQGSIGGGNENQHLLQPGVHGLQPPTQMGMGGGGGGAPPIRPNSMAERARLAKIPPPEVPLKCPRCESTNTKFCYFNNYSLSQPRHFCKTCRRYWTRGGALRNVPVGGGCRRNKRSSGGSKSSSGTSGATTSAASKSSLSSSPTVGELAVSSGANGGGLIGGGGGIPPSGNGMSSFMASLQNIAQLGMGNLGLTFGGSLHAFGGLGSPGGLDHHHSHHHHHRHPQLDFNEGHSSLLNHQVIPSPPSFFGSGFEVPAGSGPSVGGLYSDQQAVVGGGVDEISTSKGPSMVISQSQLAPVKMEDGQGGLSLAKQLMGISSSDNQSGTASQFWGVNMGNTITNMWTDLSGLNSSSASHLL